QYTLQHIGELTGNSAAEYSKMAMYERLSYEGYNSKIADYVSKLGMGDRSGTGDAIRGLMLGYEKLLARDMDSEITDYDYFWYFYARELFFSAIRGEYANALRAPISAYSEMKMTRKLREDDRSGEAFGISRIINRTGIIKFLGLDSDSRVEALNRRYGNSKQGIQLLQKLLVEQYRKTKGKVTR
ncbi:MAG: hypothetical protein KGH66_03860, partial [Candidatus Micrarchaeota archaeon]|nr:hypothetical protein [Candidatus Micrarchaeota archaeon]